jgi:SAM-dependent methyltransferase
MQHQEYALMAAVEDTHWWYCALHVLIGDAIRSRSARGRTILDAGCGTGAVLAQLDHAGTSIGIDLSPDALQFCQQRGLYALVRGDVNALPFPADTFDIVISSSVLYHQWVIDVGAAVRELRRVLKPQGVLILNLPAYRFLHSAHDDAVLTARRFTKKEVRHLLSANGFTVRRLTYWTSLLLPAAIIGRTLGGSSSGRDFEAHAGDTLRNRVLSLVMAVELAVLRRVSMPFGVAIFAVAERTGGEASLPLDGHV